jgi:hypothetical protein
MNELEKLQIELTPYSSVVGGGLMFILDGKGVLFQAGIFGSQKGITKEQSDYICRRLADGWNSTEREAQAVQREREAAKGLVEALSMIESQGNSNHEDPRHADYLRKILQSIARAALATYNDNRKG